MGSDEVIAPRWRYAAAAIAFVGYLGHAGFHVFRGHPEDALWACHIATLMIAVGHLTARALPIAIGVCWLSVGNLFWAIDLVGGGEFYPTSLLTHVMGYAIGWVGVRWMGFPKGTWWRAGLALMVGLFAITRVLTPAAANVNLAFSVHPGWEQIFPWYPLYFGTLNAMNCMVFWGVERLARRGR